MRSGQNSCLQTRSRRSKRCKRRAGRSLWWVTALTMRQRSPRQMWASPSAPARLWRLRLTALPGVREVKPKVSQKHVTVRYEPAKVQEEHLKDAVGKAGFTAIEA